MSTIPSTVELVDFAERYTAAWSSQDAARVASFFCEDGGSLAINGGIPSVGRAAIMATAQSFMTAFPDLQLTLDGVDVRADGVHYFWTLNGTNTGPGGGGHRVRFSGFEVWQFGADGLVADSQGNFDHAVYQHQLEHGIE